MADTTDELPRAATMLDPEPFKRIFHLMRQQPWLEAESDALIELWNLCDHAAEQDLLCDLLTRFTILDSGRAKECGERIADHIVKNWKLSPENTILAATSQSDAADGSQAFLQMLKDKFVGKGAWAARNFINSIGASVRKVTANSTVILVDDFAGTGDTIGRKLAWYSKELVELKIENVQIKVCFLAAMERAKGIIEDQGFEV